MTAHEELTYLFGILSEASKWASSHDDPDSVRMEVEYRIRNLISGAVPEHDNLPAEEENLTGSDYQAPESSKLNGHLPDPVKAAKSVSEWKSKRVRCQENGHPVWRPLCQCHKEKLFPDNPKSKKFRWVWDGSQDKEVNKLSDELWEAHENGNDL